MAPLIRIPTGLAVSLSALALLAPHASAQAPAASAGPCASADMHADELTTAEMGAALTCLINAERNAQGLGGVSPNAVLLGAAAGHSLAMVAEGFFAHDTPWGSTPLDRIIASRYPRRHRRWLFGENLAWGRGPDSTPRSLVAGWMASPPHRHNLLLPRFREMGVAVVAGTPLDAEDATGVTVTTEYGYRCRGKKKRKKHRRHRR